MKRKVVLASAAAAFAYAGLVRPLLWRWGASDEEVAGPFPGAEWVPCGARGVTMAVTIGAPPDRVWPWLVQMGGDRAGWYSWDHLDNAGVASARDVHPEWQDRAVGEHLKFRVPGVGMMDSYEIAILEPNRLLGLYWLSDFLGRALDPKQPRPAAYMEGLWCFQLKELERGRTRLVIGGYQATRPRWLERIYNFWIYVPVVWIMQTRMMAVLKRNIERAERTSVSGGSAPPRAG